MLVADPGLPGIVVLDVETGRTSAVHRAGSSGDPWLAPERIGYSRRLNVAAVFDGVAQTVYLLGGSLEPLSKLELPRVMIAVKDVLAVDSSTVIVAGGAVSDSIPPLGIWRFGNAVLPIMGRLPPDESSPLSATLLARHILAGGQLAETASGLLLATALDGDVWLLDRSGFWQQVATGLEASIVPEDLLRGGADGRRGIWWSMPTPLDLFPAGEQLFWELYSTPDSGRVRLLQLRPGNPSVVSYEWRDRIRAAAALSADRHVVIREAADGSRTVALLRLPGVHADSTPKT